MAFTNKCNGFEQIGFSLQNESPAVGPGSGSGERVNLKPGVV